MTPLVFGLSAIILALVTLLIIIYKTAAELEGGCTALKKERNETVDRLKDQIYKHEIGSGSRELYLKRALEDLAFAEIDRARFALEVVYGKTKL